MKFRSGLFVGAAFLAGVAVGPASGLFTGASPWAIGAAQAQDAGRADTYKLLRLFGDVFDRIRAEYVEPVNDRDLVENAINGMLTGLDPHSSYMNAKAFRDMQVQTHGEFGGPGPGSDAGERHHQGRLPDRRHPGGAGGHQVRRPDHHHRQDDGAGLVAERGGGQDARAAEQPHPPGHQAGKHRQADRADAEPGGHPHPGGQEPSGGRRRLRPADPVQRADG